MSEHYIAKEYAISQGVGVSERCLPSFDKALLDAGVGNYNLVKLSSILPAGCKKIDIKDIAKHISEGSLLPTAYSTISSDIEGDVIVSSIGVGIPVDKSNVGVIMEYSNKNIDEAQCKETLVLMIKEAFQARGWELEDIILTCISDRVDIDGVEHTTFACIAEW